MIETNTTPAAAVGDREPGAPSQQMSEWIRAAAGRVETPAHASEGVPVTKKIPAGYAGNGANQTTGAIEMGSSMNEWIRSAARRWTR